MAVYKKTLNGIEVRIHNVDHPPPHCHAFTGNKDIRINLLTLEVMNPPPVSIPAKLNKAIKNEREELLKAWENVTVIPLGRNPGEW
ncbi:MAG: DUF4160 domain-containing protein [Balneolaceae bacterium]